MIRYFAQGVGHFVQEIRFFTKEIRNSVQGIRLFAKKNRNLAQEIRLFVQEIGNFAQGINIIEQNNKYLKEVIIITKKKGNLRSRSLMNTLGKRDKGGIVKKNYKKI